MCGLQVLPAITDAKSTVLLLGQSLRETNSDRSIQEQLSDESNQINVFAFDLDPIVGDDEQEAQRYAAAHQTHLEVSCHHLLLCQLAASPHSPVFI